MANISKIASKLILIAYSDAVNSWVVKYNQDLKSLRLLIKSATLESDADKRCLAYDELKKAIEASLSDTKKGLTDLAYAGEIELEDLSDLRNKFIDLYEPLYAEAMKATGTNHKLLNKFYKA